MMKLVHRYLRLVLTVSLLGLVAQSALAIDNPDAPDYVGEFEAREKLYLDAINNPDNTTLAYTQAYGDYLDFLDKELNSAYKLLKSNLSKERQEELKVSQRNWIQFRDAEFALIDNNWTRENFGSSAAVSRGNYRTTVVRNRVLQLLYYAVNY